MMKRIYLFCGMLGVLLLLRSPLEAQTFVPSDLYRQIQVGYYQSAALPLYSNKLFETRYKRHTYMYGTYHSAQNLSVFYTTHSQSVQVTMGAWKGRVTDMSSDLAVPRLAVRRNNGIGGGDDGLAGNPEDVQQGGIGGGDGGLAGNPDYVPVGDISVWMLVLLMGVYVYRLLRKTEVIRRVRR